MSAPTDQSPRDPSRLPAATTTAAEARVTEPATFVFADIAGFTALTEAHGDQQAAELVAEFCRAVQVELPASGGCQVKSIGDALMLRIPDPSAAIQRDGDRSRLPDGCRRSASDRGDPRRREAAWRARRNLMSRR